MNQINEEVIKKIQKLLSLATSANEHEAKNAARKAQELLLKYNLDMQSLDRDFDYAGDEIFSGSELKTEIKFANSICDKYFFVTVIKGRNKKMGTTRVTMVGETTNLAIGKYVWSFLVHAFPRLWKEYKAAQTIKVPERAKQSFYYGLYDGLCEQLDAQRAATCSERGMVIVKDPGLEKAVAQLVGKTKTERSRVSIHDENAQKNGHEQGKNLKISKGIESSGGFTGGLLG